MTKSIMIQGTTSDAGKSFIAAALCRIFHQGGIDVAPFKSQNMALNSFVTLDGLEMGRAQAMQAEAAGIEPDVRMNPILLKPEGDGRSQVVVDGKVEGVMTAREYYAHRERFLEHAVDAYTSLASSHELIVLEGAGSPAEINLKDQDIVNMAMARMSHSPVLICADIDRGGVFASLYGTLALLDGPDRAMVKGTIINRFRGDVSILEPGLDMLRDLTGVPVLGVIPLTPIHLDEEDSLDLPVDTPGRAASLDIAVVRLPHISNFTDLTPLQRFRDVSLRYVDDADRLGNPDLVVIPGTKTTEDDLLWLQRNGMADTIRGLASRGTPVMGICGGYQMLGMTLEDPLGVEGQQVAMDGLGLLPTCTVFTQLKRRERVHGVVDTCTGAFAGLTGATFEGYEIHMGATQIIDSPAAGTSPTANASYSADTSSAADASPAAGGAAPGRLLSQIAPLAGGASIADGCVCGNVMGTYCHGIFDDGTFAERLVTLLMERRGLQASQMPASSYHEYREQQYDALADVVRRSIDMDAVRRIVEEGL